MKSIKKITAIFMGAAMLAAVCLTGCGGSKTPAETTAAAGGNETTEQTEAQTKAPETEAQETGAPEATATTQSYSVTDDKDGVSMIVEVPEIDGIEVEELSSKPGLRIVYDEGGWKLDLIVDTANAESLSKKISDGETLTYGENNGYVEFDSWAAKGDFDFGKVPDSALAVVISYDLRPADTYQPDDEDELRGYLEDKYVSMIFSGMQAEVAK